MINAVRYSMDTIRDALVDCVAAIERTAEVSVETAINDNSDMQSPTEEVQYWSDRDILLEWSD